MTLYLGAPLWGQKTWVGTLFPKGTKQKDFLGAYSRVFNTVEGNTTFYAIPSPDTVQRWRDETPHGFKFCLKVPQVISHHKRLVDSQGDTDAFVERLRLLGSRVGPAFLQLPPTFGVKHLDALGDWLRGWPKNLPIAVEPRHADFFGNHEAEFDALLREHNAARCIFDTASLFSIGSIDPDVTEAQRKKPRFPTRHTRTGPFAFVRFVCQPDIESNRAWLTLWADHVARWLAAGEDVFFFVHHPDDTFAPDGIRLFHTLVAAHVAVPELPSWGDSPHTPRSSVQPKLL
jgi:uncharacterized protein YecE (DUF72 family)